MPSEPFQQNPPYPPSFPPPSYPPSGYPPPSAPLTQPPAYYPPPGQVPGPPVYYNYHPELAPMPVSTSGWAIASLICSLVGIPLLGVIFGFVALNEIRNGMGRIGGEGLAKAGIIIGFIFIALGIVLAVIWVLVIGGLLLTAPTTTPSSFLGLIG